MMSYWKLLRNGQIQNQFKNLIVSARFAVNLNKKTKNCFSAPKTMVDHIGFLCGC